MSATRHRAASGSASPRSASASSTRSTTSTRRTRARSATRPRRPSAPDNHLGDVATATFDREMASTLEDNSTQCSPRSTPRWRESRTGRSASASAVGSRSAPSGSRRYRGRRSASRTSGSRNAADRAGPKHEFAPGLAHGRARADLRRRALARRAARALARPRRGRGRGGRRRPADEARRRERGRARRRGQGARAVHDPPRPELGDRLWPVRERDGGGDRADAGRSRLDGRLLRALRRAAPAAAGRCRPADRRERLQPRRPVRLGHVTDFLDFKYWPAFNLADSFIVIGVAVLLGALVAADRPPRRPGQRRRRMSNAAARP